MKHKLIFVLVFLVLFSSGIAAAKETIILAKSNLPINFDAKEIFPDSNLSSATWDFTDGMTGNGLTASHSFSENDIYRVEINAIDTNGQNLSAIQTVSIGESSFFAFSEEEANYVLISFSEFPEGVYKINVDRSDSSSVSTSGFKIGGDFFSIDSNIPDGEFKSTLTFNYIDTDNDGIVDDRSIDENTLEVYYYDGSSWKLAPSQIRSTDGNFITISTDNFANFALLSSSSNSRSGSEQQRKNSGGGAGGGGGGSIVGAVKNFFGGGDKNVSTSDSNDGTITQIDDNQRNNTLDYLSSSDQGNPVLKWIIIGIIVLIIVISLFVWKKRK